MKNILFVMSNQATMEHGKPAGCYIQELVHPLYVIKERGINIDFTSPKGGCPAFTGTDFKGPVMLQMLSDKKIMDRMTSSMPIAEVDADKYDAIFYTGGHGGMYDFINDGALINVAETIYDNGGIVSAMCHGPAGIVNLKKANGDYIIQNKKVTCFCREEEIYNDLLFDLPYVLEDKLIEHGAKYVQYGINQGCVQVSGRVITGQNMFSSHMVGVAIAEKLGY